MTIHSTVQPSCEVIPGYILDAVKSGPDLDALNGKPIIRDENGDLAIRDMSTLPNSLLTAGEKVIRWAQSSLLVPEGPKVGEPLELDIYQRVFILQVFDNPEGTQKAMLSVARRNGKTFIVAVILLAFIIGPMRSLNISMCSGANAREQAAIAFDLMVQMLILSPAIKEGVHYKYTESSKTIIGLKSNVRYKAISAEAKTGHGKAYKVILLDEAGQIQAESNDFTDMLETSMSNYDDALYLIISTQAASDAAYFSQQLDSSIVHQDPTIVTHLYCADEDCDLTDEYQWQKANPGLGKFVSKKKMTQKASEAILLPAKANGIKNLNFNQRVSTLAMLLSPEAWKHNQRPINEVSRRSAYIDIGLDLSAHTDLTAAVATWRDDNNDINVEVHTYTPLHSLKQRELRDKAPYTRWYEEGHLIATPSKTVDYEFVCNDLARKFNGCNIRSVQFDKAYMQQFTHAAMNTDFYGMVKEWEEVIQGFISMGVRVKAFEREVLNGRLRTGPSPTLNLAASHCIVSEDAAGNRKPMKNLSTQKIDTLVAAIMGVFPNSEGYVETQEFDVDSMIG